MVKSRLVVIFFLLIISFFLDCIKKKKKEYIIPVQLLNKNIKIIDQFQKENYLGTLYIDYERGTKFLLINDFFNKTDIKYEILTHGGIKTNFIDIDQDGIKDITLSFYIGGSGVHTCQYVIYSSMYKKFFYQNVNYDNDINFEGKSENIPNIIWRYLRDLSHWTNNKFSGKFGYLF